MRPTPNSRVELFRRTTGSMASDATYGNNGQFIIPGPMHEKLLVQVSDGGSWEHISVSTKRRCPTWEEMQFVKELFWDDEETVMQYHPARSRYVNVAKNCLHMWRPVGVTLPMPPLWMIG